MIWLCVITCRTLRPLGASRARTPMRASAASSWARTEAPGPKSTPGGSQSPASSGPSRRAISKLPSRAISATARRTSTGARRATTGGKALTLPMARARHSARTGHAVQRGARGTQTVAPSSMSA